MAIYQITKGTITCDKCGTLLAKIRWPKSVMDLIEEWTGRCGVICAKCEADPTHSQ